MAIGPDDPRSQRWLLGVLFLLGGFGLYWFYMYQPRSQELTEMEDRIAQLQERNRQAEQQIGNLDELRAELQQTEQLYQAVRDLVPPRAEVPAIYESIAQQVERLGIELNQVTPEEPEPVENSVFQRQQWSMAVEGPYHQVGEFVTRVASFPRIVRPMIVDLRPGGETNAGDVPVVANLTLEMFVLPPDTAAAKAAAQEGGES